VRCWISLFRFIFYFVQWTTAMFNLRLLQELRGKIPLPEGQSVTHIVSDSETGRIYSLTNKYDVIAYDPLKNTVSRVIIKNDNNI
jgi:hypothetical protein